MKIEITHPMFAQNIVELNIDALKIRLSLILKTIIEQRSWTQTSAAENLGVTQPRISNLCNSRLEKFSVDSLLQMIIRAGYEFDLRFSPQSEKKPLEIGIRKS
ncbi:helix-turn-helix domain-containing protein [Stenotrophomonas rhizophila]|uniref:helix-turn-helix domain-containing protein n=1 Tax=Stenotrophomonas rhizophila TaxID=216778 RepID=UPI00160C1672|nr:XRE family transcriptional regulator [Stenotrophomonas rhizophila]